MYTDQRLLGFLVLKKATDRQTFLWGLVCMRTNVCGREPILMKPTETFNSNQDSRSGDSKGTIYPHTTSISKCKIMQPDSPNILAA